MRIRIKSLSLRAWLLASVSLVCASPAFSGRFSADIGMQTYRDFANNKGPFKPGATDVPIYDTDGKEIGKIPLIPDFGGKVDVKVGQATLAGGQNWLMGVGHDHALGGVSFCGQQGVKAGSIYYDNYKTIFETNAGASYEGGKDVKIGRLNKMVTDAVGYDYCTDPYYAGNAANISAAYLVRVGSGIHTEVSDSGWQDVWGAYSVYIGGTIDIINASKHEFSYDVDGDGVKESYSFYSYSHPFGKPSESNPLASIGAPGDSGSPVLIFNENSGKWELLGCHSASSEAGYGSSGWLSSGMEWAQAHQDATKKAISSVSGGEWRVSGPDSSGMVSFSGSAGESFSVQALAGGLRGATSTQGKEASNAQMNAAKDWVFGGGGANIVIDGTIDTGAGGLYFTADMNLLLAGEQTLFTLSSSDASYRLNSGGYQIDQGVMVSSTLTAGLGDEWRIVGGVFLKYEEKETTKRNST